MASSYGDLFFWVYECPVMCHTQKLQKESHFIRTIFLNGSLQKQTDRIIQTVIDVETVSAFRYN